MRTLVNHYYTKAIPIDCSHGKKKARAYYKTAEDKARLPELTEEYISKVDSVAGLLDSNTAMCDFDGTQYRQPIHDLIEGENIQCRESWSQGSHGGVHVTVYINDDLQMKNSFSHGWSAIGVPMDYKCGKINAYETIKLNHKLYDVKRNYAGSMPFYLKGIDNLPEDKKTDFTSVLKGQRVNELCKWLFVLKHYYSFTPEQCFITVTIINKYILQEPLEEKELYTMVLNDGTFKKLQETSSKGKKDISLDTFKEFLDYHKITIKYNLMTKETEYYNLPDCYKSTYDKANAIPIQMLEEYKKFTNAKSIAYQTIQNYIFYIADCNAYNPVHDYFETGSWDKKDRFPIIFKILGVDNQLSMELIKKWFYQCVGMAYNNVDHPIQAEGCLILSGKEGIGKSRFFALICPDPHWFRTKSNMLRLDNKDNLLSVISGFIVELGEIDATLSNKRADIKSFITASTDNIRKPYAREESRTPRTTSFAGTTNKTEFLNDESGFRRWWNIPVKSIDKKLLETFTNNEDELHQFWLQCYETFVNDHTCFRLTDEQIEMLKDQNKNVMELLPAEEELRTVLDFESDSSKWIWVSASTLKMLPEYRVGQFNSKEIGRAINRIKQDENRIKKRISRGTAQYFIPPVREKMSRTMD